MSAPLAAFDRAWAQREVIARDPGSRGLFVALAPMDGVTDWVYRDLLTALAGGQSGISLCVSEFVRVTRDVVPAHVILRHCPELGRGGVTHSGTPVFVQLLGGVPSAMAATAARAAELGAPGIDINFGCPAKTVNNSDGGATILKTPYRVEEIVSAVRRATDDRVPVSVKVRLGWDSTEPIADIARAAEAGGGAWLTVHARTRVQLYRPPVHWHALARAREAVSFPVVANGDINRVSDLEECARVSGCHAFMIGRGAMGRPRIFRQVRGITDPDFDLPWFVNLIVEYSERLLQAGAPERASLGRVKQWLRLGAPAFKEIDALFQRVKRLNSLAEARAVLAQAPELAA